MSNQKNHKKKDDIRKCSDADVLDMWLEWKVQQKGQKNCPGIPFNYFEVMREAKRRGILIDKRMEVSR